jgi:RHS repeat-associated protein
LAKNNNTLSKSGNGENKWRYFKTRWLGKSAVSKLPRSRRALLVVLLLASSAAALTSLGIRQAIKPAPSFAHVARSGSPVNVAQATGNAPLTKLKEYVFAGGRLITSEEKSCVPTLSPTGASLPQGGGTGSVNVSTSSGCSWTATSNASWITITSGASGVGAGAVSYSVAANGGAQRSNTITINGQAFNIIQAPNPASCGYALNKTGESISEQGGSGALTLTTGAGCPWTATSNASWLSVTSAASGNGSATINYSVAANSGQQRVGVITVGGQTFTVTQAPNQASCAFALNPSSWQYPVEGGSGSFSVTTGAGCFWDAATTVGWVTITSGATGVGNGVVGFTVQANNGGSRTGGISVRGQVFTITQAQCDYVISPTGATLEYSGGSRSITVSTAAICPWSAQSNVSWITVQGGSGRSGNGTVTYSVFENGGSTRSGIITIAGKEFRVTQRSCGLTPSSCLSQPSPPIGIEQSATGESGRGLTARYFSNTTLSGQPLQQRIEPAVSFNWAGASPDGLPSADGFSARWSGQLAAPASEAYTFYMLSDGGVRLWVKNQLVIDRWQPPFEAQASSAPVELKANEKADIRVEYYNAGRKAAIHLLWGSASTPKVIIPQRHLYPEAAADKPAPTDADRQEGQQTGMLQPPGSGAGPKAIRPQSDRWPASLLGRAGLALLIACGVLALLLRINWRRSGRLFATAAARVVSRLQDQIALLGAVMRIVEQKLAGLGSWANWLWRTDVARDVYSRLVTAPRSRANISRHTSLLTPRRLWPAGASAMARRELLSWRGFNMARLKPIFHRALVIALIVILATPHSPAQAEGLVRAAQTAWWESRAYVDAAANWYGARSDNGSLNRLNNMASRARRVKAISIASQSEQVAELQVCPRQLVMFVGERYTLTPVALDSSQQVVNGVGMRWSSIDAGIADVSSFGQVEALAVGITSVEVQSGNVTKQIPVEVRSGMRPTGSNQEADIDPTGDCSFEQAAMYAPKSAAAALLEQDLIGLDGVMYDWDPESQLGSRAAHFRNAVGNPRFSATSQGGAAVPTNTQLGSYNYQFDAPVANVGGRSIDADIGMTLNSRVWNTDDGKLTFNYVGAYPAPGWSMGYGKIIRNYNATATGNSSGVGSGNSPGDYLLVAGDGTRIRLAAKYDAATDRWLHESDDGSFLQFNSRSGEMRYPDGSRMIYSSVNGCLLPTALISSNGGAITMTYRDYCEGAGCVRVFRHRTALSAVRDTLGRYLTFHYYGDSDYPVNAAGGRPAGELAAIKSPDMSGVQQEVIRVDYQAITLKYDFGGAVVDAPANNSQIQVVRRIYYPRTGKGFLFSDYSSYGMARKISTRMAMTGAGGTITDGVETAYTTYNYTTIDPSDPYGRNQVGSLSDFPQFTRREEWRLGQTDAAGAPTTATTKYDYSRATNASTEVSTIKYVDRNYEEITTAGTDSGQLSFGKPVSVERKNSATGATLNKQVFTYTTGPDGEAEIEKVETIDDIGQGSLIRFGYGRYGRVSDQYECGYKQADSYQVRRRTHYDYIDDQSHLTGRFLRLVSRASVYDAKNNNDNVDDELKAKTETTYDDYAAMGGMQSYGLNQGLYPPNHDATYDQNKVIRGNATAVKTFSRFDPEEAATRRTRFDIFGNVVEAELSCCSVKSFGFSGATAYSQPDWVRSGAVTALNLETTYQYNYFTGLVDSETSPDGLLTVYGYDRALRPQTVTAPTGAVTVTQFEQDGNGNDLLAYVSQTGYDDQGTPKVITSKQWFDGSGRAIRSGTGTGDAPDSYDMTAMVYDGWGRVVRQSNPYPGDTDGDPQAGGAQFWTTNTYDELSRVVRLTLPDNQFSETTYSGANAITTDPVGRKRKTEMDGLGRLVKVTEQNPANGNLEWETSYSYDVLDKLTQVNQGGQLRTFTYDAKGRLTSETTPEAKTTSYTYTDFDAVRTRADERGVVTTYTYGPLNLLTDVSYNTASAAGVAPTAPVSFTYKSAAPGKGQIQTVTDGAGSELYGYDNFGRLQSCARTIDGISYEKRYEYNAIGQMTLMTYPSGKRVKTGRDARGRLAAMQRVDASGATQESYLTGVNYRVDGQISSQNVGDGSTESFGYSNDRLQLTSQTVTKGGNTLLSLNYGYGAGAGQMGSGSTVGNSGQLVSVNGTINGQNRDQTFAYDNVARLVTATGWGSWARRVGYDRFGNRTGVWDAASGGNQLQNTVIEQAGGIATNRVASVNGTAYSYDASGNVTGDGARTFTYDAEKRIVSVGGSSSESYSYDASNHRLKKTSGTVVTHCVWEGDQVIAEYERGGAATQTTGTRYYHQDRLSTRVITNGDGAVVGTADHLPFGEEIGVSGEREKHKFTNYERDGTGVDYAVNRFYISQQGRFAQADPLGVSAAELTNPQSFNSYNYGLNDPINRIDPNGAIPIWLITGAIGAATGFAGSVLGQLAANGGSFDNVDWKAAGIAAGVGAVAGVLAPWTAITRTGAVLSGVASNLVQYEITQRVNNQPTDAWGYGVNAVTGAIGGAIGGAGNPRAIANNYTFYAEPLKRGHVRALATERAKASITAVSSLVRNFLGSFASNVDPGATINNMRGSGSGNGSQQGSGNISSRLRGDRDVLFNRGGPSFFQRSISQHLSWVNSIPACSDGWRGDVFVTCTFAKKPL